MVNKYQANPERTTCTHVLRPECINRPSGADKPHLGSPPTIPAHEPGPLLKLSPGGLSLYVSCVSAIFKLSYGCALL